MPSIKQLILRAWRNRKVAGPSLPRQGRVQRKKFVGIKELVADHFANYSDPDHPCRATLTMALEMLACRPATIVETGSAAWGTNSSLLFDAYVNSFGGTFASVDIRAEPSIALSKSCTNLSRFYCGDSVDFLKTLERGNSIIDLLYLDSWDVDWEDPLPSAIHGLHEFLTVFPALRPGSVVLIDDTPANESHMAAAQPTKIESFIAFRDKFGFAPGKGSLVKQWLIDRAIGREMRHEYQLLWQI